MPFVPSAPTFLVEKIVAPATAPAGGVRMQMLVFGYRANAVAEYASDVEEIGQRDSERLVLMLITVWVVFLGEMASVEDISN